MRRLNKIGLLLLLLSLVPGWAAAEEIIFFTSGSSMPIRSHEIRGEMIHVDLGGEAFMAFPRAMVERIEAAGKNVVLDRSTGAGSNVMSRSVPDPSGSHPVRGVSRRGDSKGLKLIEAPEENSDPYVDNDKSGNAVYRPQRFSRQQKKRQVGSYGHQRARSSSSSEVRGTTQLGNRHVIGNTGPRGTGAVSTRPPIVPLGRSETPPPPAPAPKGSSSSGSGSSSDSGSNP